MDILNLNRGEGLKKLSKTELENHKQLRRKTKDRIGKSANLTHHALDHGYWPVKKKIFFFKIYTGGRDSEKRYESLIQMRNCCRMVM